MMAPGSASAQNKEAMDGQGSKPGPSAPNTADPSEAFNSTSISQLRELLDEAFAYKNPKDRQGKSKVFLDLLNEVESAEDSADRPTGGRYRQDRYRVSERSGGGGSLQNICQAVEADHSSSRRRLKQYRGPGASVSARQREGGSLPSNVNNSSWALEWQSDSVRRRVDPMSEAVTTRERGAASQARHKPHVTHVTHVTQFEPQPGPSGVGAASPASTSEKAAFRIVECYNGGGLRSDILFQQLPQLGTADLKRLPDARRMRGESATEDFVTSETLSREGDVTGVYRTSATLEVGDGDDHTLEVGTAIQLQDGQTIITDVKKLGPKALSVSDDGNAPGKGKKQNKRKQAQKNEKNVTLSENMPGYRGMEDLHAILNFIENDAGQNKGAKPKTLSKQKPFDKKQHKSLHKASSLEEISQRNINDFTVNLETDRSDPILPRSESQSNLTTQYHKLTCDQQESDDDSNSNEFQMVRKKQRRKRANETSGKRPRRRSVLPRTQRRKSTSSVPHSERSAESDSDSIHSLPTHGSASYSDCDNNGSTRCKPLDASPLSHDDFPSLPSKPSLRYEKPFDSPSVDLSVDSSEASPPAPDQRHVTPQRDANDVKLFVTEVSTPQEPLAKDCTSKSQEETTALTAIDQLTHRAPLARASDAPRETKHKTRSKSVGPNSQPPVILMDGQRSQDKAVSEITFGFEVNQQLLNQTEPNPRGPDPRTYPRKTLGRPTRVITSSVRSAARSAASNLQATSTSLPRTPVTTSPLPGTTQTDLNLSKPPNQVRAVATRSSSSMTSTSSMSSMTSSGSPASSEASPGTPKVTSPPSGELVKKEVDQQTDDPRPPRPASQPWSPEVQIMHVPVVINVQLPPSRWATQQWNQPPPTHMPYQYPRQPRPPLEHVRRQVPSENRRQKSSGSVEQEELVKEQADGPTHGPVPNAESSTQGKRDSDRTRRVSDVQTSTDDLEAVLSSGPSHGAPNFPAVQESYPVPPPENVPIFTKYGPIQEPQLIYPPMPPEGAYSTVTAYKTTAPSGHSVASSEQATSDAETQPAAKKSDGSGEDVFTSERETEEGEENEDCFDEEGSVDDVEDYPPYYNNLVFSLSSRMDEMMRDPQTTYFRQDDADLEALMARTAEQRKANGCDKFFKFEGKQ